MSKEIDPFLDNAFKNCSEAISEINEHYSNCYYVDKPIPINVCRCDCYVKQVFAIGMQEKERQFYKS